MLKKIIGFAVVVMLIFTASVGLCATKEISNLVDVDFVASKIGDPNWVILDGRSQSEYDEGHIPGAVTYGQPVVGVLKNPHDGQVKSPEELAKLLGQIGVSNSKGLIVYGKKADFHVLTEMSPVYVGLDNYNYLDGGFNAWVDADKKVQTKSNKPKAATFKVKEVREDMYISTQKLMELVNNHTPNLTIIDVRSAAEFNATAVQSLRGGTIPGAIHIPHNMPIDSKTGKFKSIKELEKIYGDIPKDNIVVFYCHRGCRTAYTYMALKSLGFKNAKNYEEGWIVWGNRLDTPIANEHYRNMRGIDKKIQYLLEKVDELESKLEVGTKVKTGANKSKKAPKKSGGSMMQGC